MVAISFLVFQLLRLMSMPFNYSPGGTYEVFHILCFPLDNGLLMLGTSEYKQFTSIVTCVRQLLVKRPSVVAQVLSTRIGTVLSTSKETQTSTTTPREIPEVSIIWEEYEKIGLPQTVIESFRVIFVIHHPKLGTNDAGPHQKASSCIIFLCLSCTWIFFRSFPFLFFRFLLFFVSFPFSLFLYIVFFSN